MVGSGNQYGLEGGELKSMADEVDRTVYAIQKSSDFIVQVKERWNNFERQEFGIIRSACHGGHSGREWGPLSEGEPRGSETKDYCTHSGER